MLQHTTIHENMDTNRLNEILGTIMTAEEYGHIEHEAPYMYSLESGDKTLFYFGAPHSANPADQIFQTIEQKFNEVQPDLVLIEGWGRINNPEELERMRAVVKDGRVDKVKAIEMAGESGFTLFLALQNNIECHSPEPDDTDMYQALLEQGFSRDVIFAEQVVLLLPQYHRQMTRNGFREYVMSHIQQFERVTQWKGFDYSYEHALRIAKGLFGKEIDVENDPSPIDYVDPIPWPDKGAHQTAMNEVARATSLYRDRFMISKIADALRTHKKIFVVFGCSHAVMQEPALRKLMQA